MSRMRREKKCPEIYYVHSASNLQRPMRMNLSWCLGLIGNGQHKSTTRLLFLVPHERPHGIMRTLENPCMLLPKALKMRTVKDTMALVADSIGGTKCASAQMSWHLGCLDPALLNWQGMSKMWPKHKCDLELMKMMNAAAAFGCQVTGCNICPLWLIMVVRASEITPGPGLLIAGASALLELDTVLTFQEVRKPWSHGQAG